MTVYLTFDGVESLAERIAAIPRAQDQAISLFVAAAHVDDVERLVELLNSLDVRFYGAMFPRLIVGRGVCDSGVIAQTVTLVGEPCIVLANPDVEWLDAPPARSELPHRACTAHILVDRLAGSITGLLQDVFERYGEAASYFGAGVGVGGRVPTKVVFTHRGVFGNAAVVAFSSTSCAVTVRHGWQRIAGPFVATRTDRTSILELDWESATKVYREVLGDTLPSSLDSPEAVGVTKRHPLGISREGEEDVVRDPLHVDEDRGELLCLSDVPQNSVMHILRGDDDALIESIEQAVTDVVCGLGDIRPGHAVVYDCLSRETLLGERFGEELARLGDCIETAFPGCVVEGALALGEIGSDGRRRPEFLNKTVSLGMFHARVE
jgi:hypothetical protein